jgi:glucose/arabinose dehydrogenase
MSRLFIVAGSFAFVATLFSTSVPAVTMPLTTVRVAAGLDRPLFVTHPPEDFGRVFIVEQTGQIKILDLGSGTVLGTPFLDLGSVITCCGDRGLYALAFHPDYATNGSFYVSYTNASADSEIARYTVMGDPATSNVADPSSAAIILTIPEPFPSHNVGWIAFGPNDGYLYIAKGDGGSSCDPGQRAQDVTGLHGKLLRIDVDGGSPYAIPPDNPFVGVPGDDKIWTYGLRNPWRNAFDPATGDLFIADVGQGAWEEIDFQGATSSGGENYGWDCMEGSACSTASGCSPSGCTCGDSSLVLPIHEYAHAAECSVTGGEVYRGCAIAGLGATYFFADFCSDRIWSFRYDGATMTDLQERTAELAPGGGLDISSIVSFGQDGLRELYICDLLGGEVFKIVPDTTAPAADCNGNSVEDACDIASDSSSDTNGNGIPDECESPVPAISMKGSMVLMLALLTVLLLLPRVSSGDPTWVLRRRG